MSLVVGQLASLPLTRRLRCVISDISLIPWRVRQIIVVGWGAALVMMHIRHGVRRCAIGRIQVGAATTGTTSGAALASQSAVDLGQINDHVVVASQGFDRSLAAIERLWTSFGGCIRGLLRRSRCSARHAGFRRRTMCHIDPWAWPATPTGQALKVLRQSLANTAEVSKAAPSERWSLGRLRAVTPAFGEAHCARTPVCAHAQPSRGSGSGT